MENVKLHTHTVREGEYEDDGFPLTRHIKQVMRECKVPMECPCPDDDCLPYDTVVDDLKAQVAALTEATVLLAQRVLALENA